jgi:hypothetical protein
MNDLPNAVNLSISVNVCKEFQTASHPSYSRGESTDKIHLGFVVDGRDVLVFRDSAFDCNDLFQSSACAFADTLHLLRVIAAVCPIWRMRQSVTFGIGRVRTINRRFTKDIHSRTDFADTS